MMVQDYQENGNRFPVFDWQGAWNYLKSRGEASDAWGSSVDAFLRYARDVGLKPIPQQKRRWYRAWRDGHGGFVRKWSSVPYRKAAFGGQRSRIAGYDVLFDLNDTAVIQRAILSTGPVIVTTAIDAN